MCGLHFFQHKHSTRKVKYIDPRNLTEMIPQGMTVTATGRSSRIHLCIVCTSSSHLERDTLLITQLEMAIVNYLFEGCSLGMFLTDEPGVD